RGTSRARPVDAAGRRAALGRRPELRLAGACRRLACWVGREARWAVRTRLDNEGACLPIRPARLPGDGVESHPVHGVAARLDLPVLGRAVRCVRPGSDGVLDQLDLVADAEVVLQPDVHAL